MQRKQTSENFKLGSKMPAFELKGVNGKTFFSLKDFASAQAALVVFSCNHCPYVRGSEQFLIDVVNKYKSLGLVTAAINSNDDSQYSDDSFAKMRSKALELNMPYAYLHDATQEVARQFDAACTPECYLFNSNLELVWHGTISDSNADPYNARKIYLEHAVSQLLAGQNPEPSFVHPVGCSIKWRLPDANANS